MIKHVVGALGSIFVSLCCLGFTPLLAVLFAAGLGFVIDDAVLIPLLAVFLGITLWGMKNSRARHGVNTPFYLGIAGASAAFAGVLVFLPLNVIGLLVLVSAAVWDIVLLRNTTCQ